MIGKKGSGHVLLGFIVLLAVFGVWLVNYTNLECHSNIDCGENSYCSVGNECNAIPVIKEIEIIEKSNTFPAVILALGLIGFAIIMRHEKMAEYINKWKSRGSKQEFQNDPYYQSVSEGYSDANYQYETESK
ncbi:MAG: hypothetical protein O2779_05710 [Nanoarchaeota archaeon]|nr:hypothetical protein [Nanoarchaeota archaeon]